MVGRGGRSGHGVTNTPRPAETGGHAFGGVAQAGEFSFVLARVGVEERVNCRYRGYRTPRQYLRELARSGKT